MDRNGQALIEFVLILPILVIILFAIIDFGNIMIIRNDLESKVSDLSIIVKKSNDLENIYDTLSNRISSVDNKIESSINVNNEDNYINIKLDKEVKTITPGLNLIIGYPYKVSVERKILYEEQ